MKKEYIQPSMEAYNVLNENILDGSVPVKEGTLDGTESGFERAAKEPAWLDDNDY